MYKGAQICFKMPEFIPDDYLTYTLKALNYLHSVKFVTKMYNDTIPSLKYQV